MNNYTYKLLAYMISMALFVGACDRIDETQLPFRIIDTGLSGSINDILVENDTLWFCGGLGYENGWVHFLDSTDQINLVYEDINALNCLYTHDKKLYTGGLSHKMIRLDMHGNLEKEHFIPENNIINDIEFSDGKFYATSAQNGITSGVLWKFNSSLDIKDSLATDERGFYAIKSIGNGLALGGFGLLMDCIDQECQSNYSPSDYFKTASVYDDKAFFFGQKASVFVYDYINQNWSEIEGPDIKSSNFESIEAAHITFDGTIWLCGRSGLVVFKKKGENWRRISDLPDLDYLAINGKMNEIYVAGTGGLIVELKY